MEYIRRELSNRIQQIRATRKTFKASGMPQSGRSSTHQTTMTNLERREQLSKAGKNDLTQYFNRVTAPYDSSDTSAAPVPTVVTDVRSAYLRLRAKQQDYTDNGDFQIVKEALNLLRNPTKQHVLRKIVTDGERHTANDTTTLPMQII